MRWNSESRKEHRGIQPQNPEQSPQNGEILRLDLAIVRLNEKIQPHDEFILRLDLAILETDRAMPHLNPELPAANDLILRLDRAVVFQSRGILHQALVKLSSEEPLLRHVDSHCGRVPSIAP